MGALITGSPKLDSIMENFYSALLRMSLSLVSWV